MKTILAILLLSSISAFAQPRTSYNARAEWDASPSPQVIGYYLYVDTNSFWSGTNMVIHTNWFQRVQTGNTNLQAVVTNLLFGVTYYFVATAFDTNVPPIESDYSNELAYKLDKPVPPHMRGPTVTLNLQASKSPKGPWGTVAEYDWLAETDPAPQFYRGLLTIQP